jgi:hypothetical protein
MGFAGIAGYEANCSGDSGEKYWKRSEVETGYSESYQRLAGVREDCFIEDCKSSSFPSSIPPFQLRVSLWTSMKLKNPCVSSSHLFLSRWIINLICSPPLHFQDVFPNNCGTSECTFIKQAYKTREPPDVPRWMTPACHSSIASCPINSFQILSVCLPNGSLSPSILIYDPHASNSLSCRRFYQYHAIV